MPRHKGYKRSLAAQQRRAEQLARERQPRGVEEATAGEVKPHYSSTSSTSRQEEHKPAVEVRHRHSCSRSSPGPEIRPRSPASFHPALEEDQAVVVVGSCSPPRPSYADMVKSLPPVSSTFGTEENVSRESIKPAASKRRRSQQQVGMFYLFAVFCPVLLCTTNSYFCLQRLRKCLV
ncbi:hypothetical protein NL108_014789 [Boleophthalmus pectinirostris]|nr:hypothetical protein NL108_014789 [Boleophthalmus pectinirostris]